MHTTSRIKTNDRPFVLGHRVHLYSVVVVHTFDAFACVCASADRPNASTFFSSSFSQRRAMPTVRLSLQMLALPLEKTDLLLICCCCFFARGFFCCCLSATSRKQNAKRRLRSPNQKKNNFGDAFGEESLIEIYHCRDDFIWNVYSGSHIIIDRVKTSVCNRRNSTASARSTFKKCNFAIISTSWSISHTRFAGNSRFHVGRRSFFFYSGEQIYNSNYQRINYQESAYYRIASTALQFDSHVSQQEEKKISTQETSAVLSEYFLTFLESSLDEDFDREYRSRFSHRVFNVNGVTTFAQSSNSMENG